MQDLVCKNTGIGEKNMYQHLSIAEISFCDSFSFSALLYLNGDFDGGEFIFTEMDAKTVTVSWFSCDMT